MSEHLSKPGTSMSVPELNALAEECLQRHSYEEAHHYLTLSLQREKTVEIYRALGITSSFMRDIDKAMEFFEEALAIDEKDAETFCAIGDAYGFVNDPLQALGFYMLAIQGAPDVFKYKEKFAYLADFASFQAQNEAAEKIIINCLETPGLNCRGLTKIWRTGLLSKPFFRSILPADQDGVISFDRQKFDALADLSPFMDPYFILGLRKLIVGNPAFEELLTTLRERLLNQFNSSTLKPDMDNDRLFALTEALANYCFFTEYIFNRTAAEEEKVKDLRAQLESAPDIRNEKIRLALFGCYALLSSLENHEKIFQAFKADVSMKDLVESQIDDFGRLQKNAAAIKAITPIEDAVSNKVREQYEEFPYPRWTYLPIVSTTAEKHLQLCARKKELQVLVAGCGTGSEAIWMAMALPHAQVLAVDLSRASLAYAENKAKRFKLDNIVFRQADILQLGSIGRTFDLISCSGVLHHMKDPVRGWQVITGLLNPHGVMRIALYSEIARKNLVEALKIIKEKKYPSTAEGIRKFREDAPKILPADVYKQIIRSLDYFSLSMCRDLLFHVQEHRFTIPELQKVLSQLGLAFREMNVGGAVRAQYDGLYPDDPDRLSLDHWNEFEESHPDTFIAMYQFWCEKAIG